MSESQAHQRFTDLNVWKQARAFKLDIYQLVRQFPKEERFDLISQQGLFAAIYLKDMGDLPIKINFTFAFRQEDLYPKV